MRTSLLPLALLLVGGAGCGPAADSIVLGAAGPWSEAYGAMNRRGMELALEQVNASPTWQGRPLVIDFHDDSGSGTRAARIAAGFVADDRVRAVIGHVNSGAMVSAAKVYDGALAAVATTASSPDLTGISPWVFRVIPSDSANGAEVARWAAQRGLTRTAVLYENNSYGRGLADAFRAAYRGQIIALDPIDETDGPDDLEPHVARLRQSAPQLVFVAGIEGSGMGFLREARRQGLTATFVGGDGWTGLAALDTAAAQGAYVAAPFSPRDPRKEAQRFVAEFRRKYGMEPDGNAALGYDAAMLLADAVRETGGDREAVRDWLARVGEGAPRLGVTGPHGFTAGGDPRDKQVVMARLDRGALIVEQR